ncbi:MULTISPECIES: glycosyltransferase family 4 protein [unclassified Paenibacillus]|uniref:glycosyltransferase family 4 protein n=1 Tax=unclassified Paenibacillus TaxID=185978 RepID=UPI002F423063
MIYVAAALISFLLVFFAVPPLRRFALKVGFVDRPNKRKIHHQPIPLMGGAAIYGGCVIALLVVNGITPLSLSVILGGGILTIVGLCDDAWKAQGKDFPVWPRVILYLGAASIPSLYNIMITGITSPLNNQYYIFSPWLAWLMTTIWIFALINMLNFMDGIDGLASGVSIVSSLTLFIAAVIQGQLETAVLAIIAVGASVGFLLHNFYPARIFMGDAGATFLGYLLAVIAVHGTSKRATAISLLIPLLALGLPIADTLYVMTRRLLSGKALHQADNMHTHHFLLRWGLTQVQAVSFLYLIAAIFALFSIILLLVTG